MMDPMSMYGSMMGAGAMPAHHQHPQMPSSATMPYSADYGSPSSGYSKSPEANSINFTDYDDDFGNYYMRAAGSNKRSKMIAAHPSYVDGQQQQLQQAHFKKRSDSDSKNGDWILPTKEQEELDSGSSVDEMASNKRSKRQAPYYESSYEKEPPCFGFPLEVNVKSRIKLDQVFPIHGNSQLKKCVKLG